MLCASSFFSSKAEKGRGNEGGMGAMKGEGKIMQGQLYLLGAQFNNRAEWKEQPVLQMHCYLQSPPSARVLQKV